MNILRKKGVPCPKELVGRRGDAANETEPSLMRFYVVQLTCDWACKDRQPIRANHAHRPRAYSC
jgi:hypothetical protein